MDTGNHDCTCTKSTISYPGFPLSTRVFGGKAQASLCTYVCVVSVSNFLPIGCLASCSTLSHAMAGRRPLSAKNAEPSRGGVKAKKERYKLLSRQALVETLTNIFKDVSPLAHVTICEEDLLKPTVRAACKLCAARARA